MIRVLLLKKSKAMFRHLTCRREKDGERCDVNVKSPCAPLRAHKSCGLGQGFPNSFDFFPRADSNNQSLMMSWFASQIVLHSVVLKLLHKTIQKSTSVM
jgi:hypothetical protein